MNKSKGVKATSQFVGLLLCIVLIQTSFAAENQNQFTMNFINNSTSENATIENSTTGNATIENPMMGNATIENPMTGNATIENPIIGDLDNDGIGDLYYDGIIEDAAVNSIDPSYYYSYLVAGSSTESSVSFTNNGNEILVLNPKVIATSYMNNINESWISIGSKNATVAPGETQRFTIEMSVPWDTPGGSYHGKIAFTDDIAPNAGYNDPQYVNSMGLYLYVEAQQKIQLQTNYISDNVEAGTENEYKIKIKNVATRDLTINPTLSTSNADYIGYEQAFGNDAIEISAPSTIKAGEIANMTIRVHVPENATGTYNRYIDMNVNGKVNDGSVPQISLYFNVWQEPDPFVKTFYTTTDAPITIEISTDMYSSETGVRVSQKKDKPPFELGLTCNSSPVNLTFVKSAESGSANIESNYYYYPTWSMENKKLYQNIKDHYVAIYTAPGAIGEWEFIILPKGANNFQYSINITDSNLEKIGNATNENTATGDTSTGDATDKNVADFSASTTKGKAPLTVKFIDKSTGSPSSWSWNFGDKSTSTAQNPVHKYTKAGKYTVSLTVKNAAGSDAVEKTSCISVK